ncbi:mite group 2 allergen Gly d 2.02-like [Brevipalpus obovatus]|uniref:mite group 2 allergen Gly d 2.02-like n=1 Tax=Brevipalpus obovatus TaxID=246614 RepID=UPI003D9DE39A
MLAKAIIFVIFGTSLVLAGHPKFTACDSGVPMPNDVEIADCDGDGCVFEKTKNYDLTVNFVALQDATNPSLDIKGQTGSKVFPWWVTPVNLCENKLVPCPMKTGEKYVFQSAFDHLEACETFSGNLFYRMNDDNGNAMFCFKLKLELH